MDEDEQLLQALEESLTTARAEDRLRSQEPSAPTAPFLNQAATSATASSQQSMSDFEQQRREVMLRQAARWQQLHGQQGFEHSMQQPQAGQTAGSVGLYPPVPEPNVSAASAQAAGAYPSIPRHSDDSSSGVPESGLHTAVWSSTHQQQQPEAPDQPADPVFEELRRKQQQEEEDHRLALQLAAQFEAEDSEDVQTHHDEAAAAAELTSDGYGRFRASDGDDSDWQQVDRTPSMQQAGPDQSAAAAPDSTHSSSRPSSQAAAAAGSAAGGLLGAGVAALLAMAANAAARRAQQSQESSARASSGSEGSQQQQTHAASSSSSTGNTEQHSTHSSGEGGSAAAAAGGDASSSQGSGLSGMLGRAANALWNHMTGQQSSESSSTATATAASNTSSSGRLQQQQQQQRHQQAASQDADMRMLQQLMQHLMMGEAPSVQQALGGSSSRGSGQAGGFRIVNLPGGGFAATYSSNSGGRQQRAARAAADDPFAMYMDPGEDIFTQLLLAGARSARSNSDRQQQQGSGSRDSRDTAGFTHFDPATGYSRFEPMDQVFGPGFMGPGLAGGPHQGLQALLGALLGGQGFEGQFGGPGGMSYEDLVNLDNIHVSTPDEVLAQLPRSKFVEGRKPGDSDSCVICQTQYSPGESLMHLPCLHAFHEDCITPWLQGHSKKCPVCKTDVC